MEPNRVRSMRRHRAHNLDTIDDVQAELVWGCSIVNFECLCPIDRNRTCGMDTRGESERTFTIE